MNSLPLPVVNEFSWDEIVALLPADCRIQLSACQPALSALPAVEQQPHRRQETVLAINKEYTLIA